MFWNLNAGLLGLALSFGTLDTVGQNSPTSVNSGGGLGQLPPQVAARYFPGVASSPAQEPEFRIKEIYFKGGTPEELVKALRDAIFQTDSKKVLNVLISPEMKRVMIPPFSLQNVTLSDVFQALNNVSDNAKSGQWQLSGSSEPIWVLNPVSAGGIDPLTGLPVGMGGFRAPKEPMSCEVYPVAGYLTALKIDDITTAIQTAWNLIPNGGEQTGTLKFHKDTELLIAVGTAQQLALIKSVLSSLRQGMAEKEEMLRTQKHNLDNAANKTNSPRNGNAN
jgi:hypothetical protein